VSLPEIKGDTVKQAPAQTTNFLRLKHASTYLGFSLTTLWRLEQKDPDFPKKIRFSARCCGYRVSDLDAYLQQKMEAAS
jgi:predicted DNA-binding transcriptional regulator AlpA